MTDELTALRARVAELEGADDFEAMLRKLVHRLRQRPDLPVGTMLDQADDLLRRKGRASILRATPDPRDARIAELEAALRGIALEREGGDFQCTDYQQMRAWRQNWQKCRDIARRALGDDRG